jgi:hypothetical protein
MAEEEGVKNTICWPNGQLMVFFCGTKRNFAFAQG